MNTSKILYTIAGVLVLAAAIVFVVKARHDQAVQDAAENAAPQQQNNIQNAQSQNAHNQNAQAPNQSASQSNQAAAPASSVPSSSAPSGCPNNTDVTQTDSNGRFKPTIDVSNKVVTLQTTMGVIKIQLYGSDAPKTVENFVCLTQKGYYNGVIFHRVAHNFVIQSGDPTGTGSGGSSIYGGPFQDELYPDTQSYKAGYVKGVVAMANTGQPGSNTSQFFILLADRTDLPKNYTIFGKVIAGQDVVDKIGRLPVQPMLGPDDGKPLTTVTITKATVN